MKKYIVKLKPPFGNSIWSGPGGNNNGTFKTKEKEKDKTRRESLGSQLGNLNGVDALWNQRSYCYTVELTEAQVKIVETWPGVRAVIEVK